MSRSHLLVKGQVSVQRDFGEAFKSYKHICNSYTLIARYILDILMSRSHLQVKGQVCVQRDFVEAFMSYKHICNSYTLIARFLTYIYKHGAQLDENNFHNNQKINKQMAILFFLEEHSHCNFNKKKQLYNCKILLCIYLLCYVMIVYL